MYRQPQAAPQSAIASAQRGPVAGKFCKSCGSTFSVHQAIHRGKGVYSKDHIASPCPHEGDFFAPGEDWWEPAVIVLPVTGDDTDVEKETAS